MTINFMKLSPGGNETIIVESAVPASERASTARRLMSNIIGADQVGYMSYPKVAGIDARLDMMGGELCINGIRCVAQILASRNQKTQFFITSSGTDRIFECRTRFEKDRCFVSMTLTMKLAVTTLERNVYLIHLDGISMLLCECYAGEIVGGPVPMFTKFRERYQKEFDGIPAFGVVPFLRLEKAYSIFPVIYVRDTDSTTVETGCGSASIALAIAIRGKNPEEFLVNQPSGSCYELEISNSTEGISVVLGSFVDQLMTGTAYM